MIQLTRERTEAAIPAVFRGSGRRTRELALLRARRKWLQEGGTGTFPLESGLWKPAKDQLVKETGEKCGYCEASSRAVSHCDVEHIRPKSIYWWLALCWDNYVLSCQLCNQTFKSDKYPLQRDRRLPPPPLDAATTDVALEKLPGTFGPDPLDDSQGQTRETFRRHFRDEEPGLIEPYFDNPILYFVWEPDADQEHVRIKPRYATGTRNWRALRSIETLGLNREELLRIRWMTYRPVAQLCEIYKSGLLDTNAALKARTAATLRAAMEPRQFFAGMCRWTIRVQFGLAL